MIYITSSKAVAVRQKTAPQHYGTINLLFMFGVLPSNGFWFVTVKRHAKKRDMVKGVCQNYAKIGTNNVEIVRYIQV